MNQPETQTVEVASEVVEDKKVPGIEEALDFLLSAKPQPREKLHSFVRRCTKTLNGSKQRELLYTAIMESLNEAGFKAMDYAKVVQSALNDIDPSELEDTPTPTTH